MPYLTYLLSVTGYLGFFHLLAIWIMLIWKFMYGFGVDTNFYYTWVCTKSEIAGSDSIFSVLINCYTSPKKLHNFTLWSAMYEVSIFPHSSPISVIICPFDYSQCSWRRRSNMSCHWEDNLELRAIWHLTHTFFLQCAISAHHSRTSHCQGQSLEKVMCCLDDVQDWTQLKACI